MSTWLSLLAKQKTYEITKLLPETEYTVSISGTYNEPIEVWLTTLTTDEDGIVETEVSENNAVYVGDLENNKLTFTAQESHTALVIRTLEDLELTTIQLEKGTIATDWTPAPEEQEQRLSIIEQTAGEIRLEVSELDGKVGSNTAQLSVQAGEISSKVSADGVISAINQTAETIKINANRIELEGTITANNNFKILLDGSVEGTNAKFINATITGNLTAGTIAGLNFNNSAITFPDGNLVLNSSTNSIEIGTARLKHYPFADWNNPSITRDGLVLETSSGASGGIIRFEVLSGGTNFSSITVADITPPNGVLTIGGKSGPLTGELAASSLTATNAFYFQGRAVTRRSDGVLIAT